MCVLTHTILFVVEMSNESDENLLLNLGFWKKLFKVRFFEFLFQNLGNYVRFLKIVLNLSTSQSGEQSNYGSDLVV